MKLYSENENYKLYNGNMLNMLEVIETQSIDSIVTDPPYELNFMNKGWDNSGIAFQPDTWKKCYEVLKPGGYLLAFGGSRTFHRIACAIEDAGFEIRDTIMWLYGSGFPKSMDISKSLDKRNGRNYNDDFKTYINDKRLEKNISFKTINEELGTSTNGGGMASNIFGNKLEKNNVLPTKEQYEIIKDLLELDNRYDDLININEAEREVIGKYKGAVQTGITKGFNSSISDEFGRTEVNITLPSTDLAKQWNGWGTALKPSFEPIIVARKPFKGSLVDNVIEWGVGGINIDECRVEIDMVNDPDLRKSKATNTKIPIVGSKHGKELGMHERHNHNGRFPANTILTYDETDFDEVCGGFPNTKTGSIKPYKRNMKNQNCYGKLGETVTTNHNGDSGSASRYFYCAKASKRDRDEGLDEFEEKATRVLNATNPELDQKDDVSSRFITIKKNTHPTVKPTSLMQYLVRLVTPNGGVVLDPFNGSGSTGKAVMYENYERNKNYKYIGIELTEEYLPIAKARIEYVCNLEPEENPQMSIFDMEG